MRFDEGNVPPLPAAGLLPHETKKTISSRVFAGQGYHLAPALAKPKGLASWEEDLG